MPLIASTTRGRAFSPGTPGQADLWTQFSLLLACCRVDDARSGQLRAALSGFSDWPRFLELAEHHNVTPLAYQSLRDFEPLVPAELLEELRRCYEQNARRNLRFKAELARILACFEANSIAAIPFKGPVLAETLYGDLALRTFSDLDLLVDSADIPRVKSALSTLGYSPALTLSAREERAYLDSAYEYVFDGPDDHNLLEIQWRIVPRFYAVEFDLADFFRRASPAVVGSLKVRTLSNEDLLLALATHAAKHLWARLCWLRDLAGLVSTRNFDVNLVERQAAEMGIQRILAVSLLLSNRLLGAVYPAAWEGKWRNDREIGALCDDVERHIPAGPEYDTETLRYFRWMMRLREHPLDRWRLLSRLAWTPGVGEWSLLKLPGPLFPLYHVVRGVRLAGRILTRHRA